MSYLKSWGTEVEADWRYIMASEGDILKRTFSRSVSHSCSSSPALLRAANILTTSAPPSSSCSTPLPSGESPILIGVWPLVLARLVLDTPPFLVVLLSDVPFDSSRPVPGSVPLRAFRGNLFTAAQGGREGEGGR